jgi:hypothetical protein
MTPDELEKLPNFADIQARIFSDAKGKITIGGVELKPEVRDLLKEQAKYIDRSDIWDILSASIANEAINLALIQSQDFDHVQFAKALWHWSTFMRNVILKLSKD